MRIALTRKQVADDLGVGMSTLIKCKEQACLSLGSYGRRRMTEELKEIGLNAGHRREGDSDHKFTIAPNLLDRNFSANKRNQKWVGDISCVWTREGWLYLAVILALYARRVTGWAVSNRMTRDLATRTLRMAIAFRSPPKGCILHTDRGSLYCLHDYQKILLQHGFKVSMSGKDNCYHNAALSRQHAMHAPAGQWSKRPLRPSRQC